MVIRTTGYKLREALRNWRTLRDIHAKRFNETIWQFEESKQDTPVKVAQDFQKADRAVAELEAAQQQFNQNVRVSVAGEAMNLSCAIKLVGGAGRLEKMWRSVASDTGRDRYSSRELTRKTDEERAVRMVSVDESIQLARDAAKYASELRSAIAEANSQLVDVELSSDLISQN